MAKDKLKLRKTLFSSYFSTTLSISLVLFLFGLLGLLLINTKRLTDYVMENVGVTLILKENTREVDILKLQKNLETTPYIKSTRFVDKQTAADELKKELGEDFVDFLGYNPLLSSMDVKVHAEYANPDSLKLLEATFLKFPEVQEVYYQRNLVKQLNSNVQRLSFILLVLSVLMFTIFIALINNTIRISIYSKRYLINSMQLVGATRSFIRFPFIVKSVLHGIYGAIIACFILLMIFVSYQSELKDFIDFQDSASLALLIGGIFAFGIIMTALSTYFAVNKFLRMKFDQLYY
ncbi:MAG: ABC transporter permease [Bacteroidetes bacterium]|nr:ABC transporter permease [Bacteroidota bacterium]MCL6103166.1 ABC transporter permease [Bacteroidota bacterium]